MWGSVWGFSRGFEQGTVDLLAKACAHAGMKAIGVKTTVITSDPFCRRGVFNQKKKKKHEQMDGLVGFCQEV